VGYRSGGEYSDVPPSLTAATRNSYDVAAASPEIVAEVVVDVGRYSDSHDPAPNARNCTL
jgi:hypothetical protein